MKLAAWIVLAGACACAGPQRVPLGPSVGAWVEAQGRLTPQGPQLREVEERPRGASDKPEKFTVTAPVERAVAAGEAPALLGTEYRVDQDTEFEDLVRQPAAPFALAAGDWVRVKARVKDDGSIAAREVRQLDGRKEFEVEGELTALDSAGGSATIGPLTLPLAPDARLLSLQEVERDIGDEIDPDDPLALFLEDEQKGVPFSVALGDSLRLGGDVSFGLELRDEYDLRRQGDGDRTDLDLSAKIDLLWSFGLNGSFALFEARAGVEERFEQGDPDRSDSDAQVSRAYVYLRPHDDVRVQLGRQDFDEEREWLYDEILDGGRASWRLGGIELEGFAAAGREFLAEDNALEDNYFLGGHLHWNVDDEHRVGAYFLQRVDSTTANFEPWLAGVRSFARPWRGLGHWLELAHAGGYDGFQKIDGEAVDVGALWRFDAAWRPTVAAGYARASGELDGSGRQGFRQLGIQDNNAKFGGVTSFRYYGEVLEPELANLEVLTLGFGVRPARRLAVDLVLHAYRQDTASQAQWFSRLRDRPDGSSRDIGTGVDLVVGYRPARSWSLELVGARFDPGDAFADQDAAHKAELSVRWKW